MKKSPLKRIYAVLFKRFGQQHWWPGDSPFEIAVGAILTQNTNWQNVSRAIANLKKARVLQPERLLRLSPARTAGLIRPSGYFRLKTKRLRNFLSVLSARYGNDPARMKKVPLAALRPELLSINGIGPETADSMLLYAFDKPVFVVDAYTRRILSRHRLIPESASYADIQAFFMKGLCPNVRLFNEFHALIVRLGKEYCLKNNPRCGLCPLKNEK